MVILIVHRLNQRTNMFRMKADLKKPNGVFSIRHDIIRLTDAHFAASVVSNFA